MSTYLLPELSQKSLDKKTFPLLPEKNEPFFRHHDLCYPRFVEISENQRPLFSGGIVTDQELDLIGYGISRAIYERQQGKALLIVTVLEGARPFASLVEQHLRCMAQQGNIRADFSSLQVRSYKKGSMAMQHEILRSLKCTVGEKAGERVADLSAYDALLLLDDLIDTGATLGWLASTYFPALGARQVESYCMLEKKVNRSAGEHHQEEICIPVVGKMVPDEWVVGFGLDFALPSAPSESRGLHLFREALPGGIYAFNKSIETELLQFCQVDQHSIEEQLRVYLTEK